MGLQSANHMDRTMPSAGKTRTLDRTALIRTSMLLFALLAVASFALAGVVG
jgi:hypothetical protein